MPIVYGDDPVEEQRKKQQQASEDAQQAAMSQQVHDSYVAAGGSAQDFTNKLVQDRATAYYAGFGNKFAHPVENWGNVPSNPNPLTPQENHWWIEHPEHLGNTISLNVPEHHHDALAKYFPNVYKYAAKKDQIAGIPGVLTGMRLRAMALTDRAERRWALGVIDGFSRMGASDQQMLLSLVMEQSGTTDPNKLYDTFLNDASAGRQWHLDQQEALRIHRQDQQDQLRGVVNQMNEPREAQPNWWKLTNEERHAAVNDPSSPLYGMPDTTFHTALTMKDFLTLMAGTVAIPAAVAGAGIAGSAAAAGFEAIPGAAAGVNALASTAVSGALGVGGIMAGSKAGSMALRGAGGAATRTSTGQGTLASAPFLGGLLRFAGSDATHVADAAGMAARGSTRALTAAVHGLGTATAAGVYMASLGGDKAWHGVFGGSGGGYVMTDTQINIAGQVELALLLHTATAAGGAVTTSLSATAEAAKAELGVGSTLDETLASAKFSPLHPYASLTDPIVRYAAYTMTQMLYDTSPAAVIERWGNKGMFGTRGLFAVIEDFQKSHGMDEAGATKTFGDIQLRYPEMPQRMAEILSSTPRDEMTGAMMTYIDDAGIAEFKSTLGRLNSLTATINRLQRNLLPENVLRVPHGEVPTVEEVQAGEPINMHLVHGQRTETIPTVEGAGGMLSTTPEGEYAATFAQPFPGVEPGFTYDQNVTLNKIWDERAPMTPEIRAQLIDTMQQAGLDTNAPLAGRNGQSLQDIIDEAQNLGDVRKTQLHLGGPGDRTGMQPIGDTSLERSDIWFRDFLRQQGYDAIINRDANGVGAGWEVKLLDQASLSGSTLDPEKVAQLEQAQADRLAMESKINELNANPYEPLRDLPNRKTLPQFLHRVLYRPVGPVETFLSALMNPMRYAKGAVKWSAESVFGHTFADTTLNEFKQPWIAKLVDKLDAMPKLEYVSDEAPMGERVVKQNQNRVNLTRFLQRLGVSTDESAAMVGRLASAKTQDEWLGIVNNELFGHITVDGEATGLVARHLPESTPQWLRDRILSTSDTSSEAARWKVPVTAPDGVTDMRSLLTEGTIQGSEKSLPAAPSMFLRTVPLPIGSMEEALGTVSRWRARIGSTAFRSELTSLLEADPAALTDVANHTAAWVYDFGKAAMGLTTAIGKPLAMTANVLAIIMTKMMDESLGNAADPRIQSIFSTRANSLDYFTRIDPRIVGRAVTNGSWMAADPAAEVAWSSVPVSAADILAKGHIDDATAEGLASKIVEMTRDPMLSRFVREGMDPGEMLAIMTDPKHPKFDPELARFYRDQLTPQLEKSVAAEQAAGPEIVYRGQNANTGYGKAPGLERGSSPWGSSNAFVSSDPFEAQRYAGFLEGGDIAKTGTVTKFEVKPTANVLREGTPEFNQAVQQAGIELPANGMWGPTELNRLTQYVRRQNRVGMPENFIHAIQMSDQSGLGTAVLDQGYFGTGTIIGRSAEEVNRATDFVSQRATQLLNDWKSVINDTSLNHPDLTEFIGWGRTGGRGLPDGILHNLPQDTVHEYAQLMNNTSALRDQIAEKAATLNDGDAAARAQSRAELWGMQQHVNDLYRQMNQMETDILGDGFKVNDLLGSDEATRQVRRTEATALAKKIQGMYDNGELKLPDKFTLPSQEVRYRGMSVPDQMDAWASQISEFMYRHNFPLIGKAEGRFAKGSFFAQRYNDITKSYMALGVPEAEAKVLGEWKAVDQTRDIFYDISTRSTAERGFRHVFWFAPVQGELMYRWAYAIPAQAGGLLPGAVLLAAKAINYQHLFEEAGLVHHDPVTGQRVIGVSGLANLINHWTGDHLKLPGIEQIPEASLQPHLFSSAGSVFPLPQLSILPAQGLTKLSKHFPALRGLANALAQNQDMQIMPSALVSALGMMGVDAANLPFSTDYQKLQWARAHDVGLQYAYTDMVKRGILPPPATGLDPTVPGYIKPDGTKKTSALIDQARNNYNVAMAGYWEQLTSLGNQYAEGTFAMRTISSALLPGYIQASSPEQQQFQNFMSNILPKEVPQGGGSDAVFAAIQRYVGDHPEGLAFSISYNYYTGKDWTIPYQETDPQYGRELLAQGVKAPMSPEDYSYFLVGKATRDAYTAKLNGYINELAPDGKAQTLLRNWYKRGVAVENTAIAQDTWNKLNPHAVDIMNEVALAAQKKGLYPVRALEVQYVAEAMTAMRRLAPLFSGQGSVSTDAYNTAMSSLGRARAALYQSNGGTVSALDKGINHFFDDILHPYMKATEPIYQEAAAAQAAGADPSVVAAIYHRIDLIKQQYGRPKDGYPSPDEFFYAAKNPHDQELSRLNWLTKPVSWLSPFQRETSGYGKQDRLQNEMWDSLYNWTKDNYLPALAKVSPNSKAHDALVAWGQQNRLIAADYYAKQGLRNARQLVAMDSAPAYVRLRFAKYGGSNPYWVNTYAAADAANKEITASGASPKGFAMSGSVSTTDEKVWFYTNLQRFMTTPARDPRTGKVDHDLEQFQRQMANIGSSQTTVGTTGLTPTGLQLYEGIFFNDYTGVKYAPPEVTKVFLPKKASA